MNDALSRLTPRQREVLALHACGATYQQIADALEITYYTVKSHLVHISRLCDLSPRQLPALYFGAEPYRGPEAESMPFTRDSSDPLARLTPYKQRVLALYARGASDGCIADELGLSPHTVRNHIARIAQIAGVSPRQLVALYFGAEVESERADDATRKEAP